MSPPSLPSPSLPLPILRKKLTQKLPSGGVGGPVALATTGVTFLPLSTVSERAPELIAKAERDIASKADTLAPGLKEQYAAQLAMHKSGTVPTVEFIVFPFNPHPTGASSLPLSPPASPRAGAGAS